LCVLPQALTCNNVNLQNLDYIQEANEHEAAKESNYYQVFFELFKN